MPGPYSAATVGMVPKMPEPTMQPIPMSMAPMRPIFFFSMFFTSQAAFSEHNNAH